MSTDLNEKKKELREELDKLNHEFKIELPKKIAEARAYGDLKENAEYHAARERQSFVKARIAQVSDQLAKVSDIDLDNIPEDKIGYGSEVTVIDMDSEDDIQFKIVSSDEVNPAEGKISVSSPIGQALHNKMVGEEVEVIIPAGKRKYYIEKLVSVHGNVIEKKFEE